MDAQRLLVIGVGNLYRNDDSIGLLAARRLKKYKSERLNVLEQDGDGVTLMDSWKGCNRVILIDAVSSGAAPGTVHRLDASENSLPAEFFSCSTHAIGVAQAVELARSLEQLPESIRVFGIEGKDFRPGQEVSAEALSSMENVVQEILKEIEHA